MNMGISQSSTISLVALLLPTSAFTPTPEQRESIVNAKDRNQIANCFADRAIIRDVCGINSLERSVNPQDLADRCMEFLQAHPDCVVRFHYGPECGRDSNWVVANWYETGHWTGESRGIKASGNPMAVEGQTRFLLVSDDLKIEKFVVTR
ncbi:LOW QUALITY PROTEIN: hypothetical protein ACHAWO_001460 [Cyclotella atomus]|uniref:Uncharacterized protein n=1 Tax=Cyclotella atomus TaxID=382360 RepID=A0ABD3PDY4_9STRA